MHGSALIGKAVCNGSDSPFVVTDSDVTFSDTALTTQTVKESNRAPQMTDTTSEVFVPNGMPSGDFSTIIDSDDAVYSIVHDDPPHMRVVRQLSIAGVAPDGLFDEMLTVSASTYSNGDTLAFAV